jgi:putative SOS response-associated peptidase YedK
LAGVHVEDLEGDGLALWLNPKTPVDGLEELLAPARDDLLVSQPVSPLVNDHHNDGPELITGPGTEVPC